MLKFKSDQLDAFRRARIERFEVRTVARLRRYFETCLSMRDEELLALIQRGSLQAEGHGFNSEREKAKFIGLMIVLGMDFDQRADLPWVKDILMGGGDERNTRLERLYEKAAKEAK